MIFTALITTTQMAAADTVNIIYHLTGRMISTIMVSCPVSFHKESTINENCDFLRFHKPEGN